MKLGELIDQTSVRRQRGGGFLPTSKNAEKIVRFCDSKTGTCFEIEDIRWDDLRVFLVGKPAKAWARKKPRRRRKKAANG